MIGWYLAHADVLSRMATEFAEPGVEAVFSDLAGSALSDIQQTAPSTSWSAAR